jgi:hypothetical protein
MESPNGYYVTQKTKLLTDFQENFVKFGRSIISSHFGDDLTDTILKETYQEYEALIPKIPQVSDWSATKLIESTWSLALYRVLKMHGKTVEEAGQISCEIISARFNSIPLPLRRLMAEKFLSKSSLQEMKKAAAESQKRLYPEDNVWSFVEGDGVEFDYGMDFTECAIYKFFRAQGASELAPYMCLHDFIVGKAFGSELVRTTTIAEGGKKCDLRYKRSKETKQG